MTLRGILQLCLFAWLSLVAAPVWADNFRPAYLQLTERPGNLYDVRWKAPAQSEVMVMPIKPVFPPGSAMTRPLISSYASGATVMAGQVKIPGGLSGKTIGFDGLASTGNQALVRLVRMDGSEELHRVSPADPKLTISEVPDAMSISARYAQLGIEHILLGFDHLLFVAALVMLVANLRTLIWTVTSFTVAHSITLAVVTLGFVNVPRPPVEAFIALSILFVAVEIMRQRQGRPSLASRRPWLVAFAFGLLHGLGFASALAEIGLPQNNIPLALLFFNIGVEVGQLMFVSALLLLATVARRFAKPAQLASGASVAVYAIGGIASYWLIDRVIAFA